MSKVGFGHTQMLVFLWSSLLKPTLASPSPFPAEERLLAVARMSGCCVLPIIAEEKLRDSIRPGDGLEVGF